MIKEQIKKYFLNKRHKFFSLIAEKYPHYKTQNGIAEEIVDGYINSIDILLDAGCGRNATFQKAKQKAGLVAGVDLDLEIGSNKSIDYAVRGDIQRLPFKNEAFNLIITRNVIEHLKKPELFFSEVSRLLKPNGKLTFVTPNRYGFRTLIALLIPNAFHQIIVKAIDGRDEADTFPTYYRANTVTTLNAQLNKCGMRPYQLKMFQGYPPLPFSLLLTRIMILYERLINKYEALAFLRSVIIGVYVKGGKS